jgi:DNA-binding IclR family transcriptional regulator
VSLARALTRLPCDVETERVLRDVLSVFGHHASEWLSERDIQTKTGHSGSEVHAVLPVLSDSYVLDFDGESGRYRYGGDVALGIEIDTFMRRVRVHQNHVQTNVARFRSRYGS